MVELEFKEIEDIAKIAISQLCHMVELELLSNEVLDIKVLELNVNGFIVFGHIEIRQTMKTWNNCP